MGPKTALHPVCISPPLHLLPHLPWRQSTAVAAAETNWTVGPSKEFALDCAQAGSDGAPEACKQDVRTRLASDACAHSCRTVLTFETKCAFLSHLAAVHGLEQVERDIARALTAVNSPDGLSSVLAAEEAEAVRVEQQVRGRSVRGRLVRGRSVRGRSVR